MVKIEKNKNIIKVSEYGKIQVYWTDKPEDYSRSNKLKIRNYFAKKYGIDKVNINVIYQPIKIGKNGELIKIDGGGIDNILDKNYQRQLMKKWCERANKNINFEKILELDDKVNSKMSSENLLITHKKWELKWISIDNFLSFGEKNFISFDKLRGLNIVTSIPENQGGKSNLSIDSIKFLLYGRTTKTTTNSEIFNTYRDSNSLVVRGMIDISGEELIIERKLTRSKKRSGGWTVVNKVNYYSIMPDGEERGMNDEDAKKTNIKIRENIGSEKDFDITLLATARNLEDLVEAKTTENGRLLTKFIGLEAIEEKETICKKMYSDFNKTKHGNNYNIASLIEDNRSNLENLKLCDLALVANNKKLIIIENDLKILENEKDKKLSSKLPVDSNISQLNPENIERDIASITESGLNYKKKIGTLNKAIDKIKKISYDEYEYSESVKKVNSLKIKIGKLNTDIDNFGKIIDNLKNDEVCELCKRPLKGVDNSIQISDNEIKLDNALSELKKTKLELIELEKKTNEINDNRLIVNNRNRLELERDKNEVEIGILRNKIYAKKIDLKSYKQNEEIIKINLDIDIEVSKIKTRIVVVNKSETDIREKIYNEQTSKASHNSSIKMNNEMIEKLKHEDKIDRVYKTYLEIVGKRGISKLVLRSVLPIINSELERLLDGVCDFNVELFMNDKNEVGYLLIKDEVEKYLKSGSGLERTLASLAIRCVLSKISYLPMPNFITFDEILGKVADINIQKLKPMFDKIKNMFDIVFFITHNDLVKDWGDNIITIKKINNISEITIK